MADPTPRRVRLMSGSNEALALYLEGDVAFELETARFVSWQEVQRVRDEIVRAVNALPELVAALEEAEMYVPCACPPFSGGNVEPSCTWCRINRALALARGEEETND